MTAALGSLLVGYYYLQRKHPMKKTPTRRRNPVAIARRFQAASRATSYEGLGFWADDPPSDQRSTTILTKRPDGSVDLHLDESETHTGLLDGDRARHQLRHAATILGDAEGNGQVLLAQSKLRRAIRSAEARVGSGWGVSAQIEAIRDRAVALGIAVGWANANANAGLGRD